VLICGLPAAASPAARRVAVLEFQGRAVDDEARMTLSDAVRGGVLDAARGRDLLVMTRENMAALLKEMGKPDCSEGDCEVETARNIGADYVLSGEIARIEGTYVVTLKLHESDDGRLLSTATARGPTQLDLIDPLHKRGRELVSANIDAVPASLQEIPQRSATPAPELATSASGHDAWTPDGDALQLPEEPRTPSTLRVVSLGVMPSASAPPPQTGYTAGGPGDSKLAYVPADVSHDVEILLQAASAKSLMGYGSGNEQPDAAASGVDPAILLGMYQSMPVLAGPSPRAVATARARLGARASAAPPPGAPARRLAGPRMAFRHPGVAPRASAIAFRAPGRGRR
jgi:TolB-like protein